MAEGAVVLGYNYFVVKTALPSPFLAKKWRHGYKAERKTASNFVQTKRRGKGPKENYTFFQIVSIRKSTYSLTLIKLIN